MWYRGAAMKASEHRKALTHAKRVVIKFGTRVLVDSRGRPSPARLEAIVDQVSALHAEGREVVIVSSGAVGAGLDLLGFKKRPTALSDLQMAAAVGQTRLMHLYSDLFRARGLVTGQILLNHDDLKNRERHLNAHNTLVALLEKRVIPIVNENDVVSVSEIRLGDNDHLAALVSVLIDADVLALCTTVNGLRAPAAAGRTRCVPYLNKVTQTELDLVFGKGSALSTGGMATKLEAAQTANQAGALAAIVDGRKSDTLLRLFRGDNVGTLLAPLEDTKRLRTKRKHWIAFFHRCSGTLTVDAGAERALLTKGRSLLAAGVISVQGTFQTGSVVAVESTEGKQLATGLTEFSSEELKQIQGKKSEAILKILGPAVSTEVIHRDNLALTLDQESDV